MITLHRPFWSEAKNIQSALTNNRGNITGRFSTIAKIYIACIEEKIKQDQHGV